MIDETQRPDELHDELLEGPLERFLDWLMKLPSTLRVVVGCGTLLVTFALGMLVWELLIEFIF